MSISADRHMHVTLTLHPLPSTELVLLDLAVMKAASQPHLHSFYTQILAQRNVYAHHACTRARALRHSRVALNASFAVPILQRDEASAATAASSVGADVLAAHGGNRASLQKSLNAKKSVVGDLSHVRSLSPAAERNARAEAGSPVQHDAAAGRHQPETMDTL